MARHKNIEWNIPYPNYTWDDARTALLMDILDELQQLNRVFACLNFQRMPSDLAQIRKNTTKRKYRRLPNGQRKLIR